MATNTQTPRHKLTILEGDLILELASVITQQGAGDMESSTYDPQGIEGDAFDMANMTEGADAKVLTAAERAAIAALGTASTREADQNLRTTDNVEFAEVTAPTVNLHTAAFDTTNGGPTALGEVAWDSTDGTLDLQADGGVKIAIGEDGLIRVRNTSGSTIPKGAPLVYLGTNGASTKIDVGPWTGANVSNVRTFLGFAAGEMLNNTDGYATWFGKIKEIATDGGAENWQDSDIIYAVPGASATLSNIEPASGDYVTAAVVINAGSGTSGSLFVRPTFETASSAADQSLNTTDSPTFQSLTLNNGLSASELLVYGSDDGAGNYTRTSFTHSAGGDLTIETEAGGSGTAGRVNIGLAGYAGKFAVAGEFNQLSPTGQFAAFFYNSGSTLRASGVYIRAGYPSYQSFALDVRDRNNNPILICDGYQNVGIGTTTPSEKLEVSGNIKSSGTIQHGSYLFANLPSPTTADQRAFCTDSDTAASGNFGNTFAGGGANYVPCYSDGTNWRIG